jgi:hypothetical protein
MSLSTPNSSFILLLRLRSMILCAVFRAILRPAALVADGCFRLDPAVVFAGCAGLGGSSSGDADETEPVFGFICIILRARLGGGGRSYCIVVSSLFLWEPDNVLLRARLEPSGLSVGDTGGDGRGCGLWFIAGGPREKAVSISSRSLAGRSVEADGVGGGFGRGMLSKSQSAQNCQCSTGRTRREEVEHILAGG